MTRNNIRAYSRCRSLECAQSHRPGNYRQDTPLSAQPVRYYTAANASNVQVLHLHSDSNAAIVASI